MVQRKGGTTLGRVFMLLIYCYYTRERVWHVCGAGDDFTCMNSSQKRWRQTKAALCGDSALLPRRCFTNEDDRTTATVHVPFMCLGGRRGRCGEAARPRRSQGKVWPGSRMAPSLFFSSGASPLLRLPGSSPALPWLCKS